MEFEVSYSLENEQQFWEELEDIVNVQCESHESIDNALRSYISFTTSFKEEYLQAPDDIERCTARLLTSVVFQPHKEYVRRQLVYGLLQEDEAPTLHLIAAFLLYDGRNEDQTFEMMQVEGAFPRLLELIQGQVAQEDGNLHRLLLKLLYEMSRIQRLTWDDLVAVQDSFVLYLFQIIEELSNDVSDPYHYPVIRVLLVLNEQYMVASTTSAHAQKSLTNRVMKALSTHGHLYKTFGENLILLLNRESETSLQLLILKLLYLLFQSGSTAEYFYTNDLHVLVDVMVRNLFDLPTDSAPAAALRHTYLRVFHPMLANSQISRPPHYKRAEILKLLNYLMDSNSGTGFHFAPVDETTARLAKRCLDVVWLRPPEEDKPIESPMITFDEVESQENFGSGAGEGQGNKEVAKRMLGMSVKEGGESALSVVEVAAHMEKPGVKMPSKAANGAGR